MDRVTQLQKQLDHLTTEFYEYVGRLQRDAAPSPLFHQHPGLDAQQQKLWEEQKRVNEQQARGLAAALVKTSQGIDELIGRLPGVEMSEEEQLAHLERLEQENEEAGKRLRAIIVRAESKLDQVRQVIRTISEDRVAIVKASSSSSSLAPPAHS